MPLQQLAYGAVVFLLAPFLILTGAAQSPAIDARFPRYVELFGGRQGARSLHFLGLVAFLLFIVIHVSLVVLTGFGDNMGNIILGQHDHDQGLAIAIGLGIIALSVLAWALTSWASRRAPRTWQHHSRRDHPAGAARTLLRLALPPNLLAGGHFPHHDPQRLPA